MKPANILEEEIKNKVAQHFFSKFDCTKILGKIDFAVKASPPSPLQIVEGCPIGRGEAEYLLWAEAKQKPTDILVMLTQLVLTIGKARTFDEIMPPQFLGCYDSEKIAFVPYYEVQPVFYQNDFNWNVTPSNHDTKEFRQVYEQIKKIVDNDIPWETYIFDFEKDEKDLRRFIRENFDINKGINPLVINKLRIDKNNFIIIYNKWLETVKPSIGVNWDKAEAKGILDGHFYLADLLSAENKTIKEKLFVLLKGNYYEFDRIIDKTEFDTFKRAEFKDNGKAHTLFWNKYERPPKEEYWDYIIERQDLLVPQDVRERKGSFFTPQIWVELSQRYIADVLGEDWQDEYYVWDCAAGTGNLLAGLTNKYNIWASTLDKADVDAMFTRIDSMNKNSISGNGANLLESHVFQFDFLNDDFSKLPQGLQDIINNEEKRKKLVIYINPPYAEASNRQTIAGNGENKSNVATQTKVYQNFSNIVGNATRELFAQFFLRIYKEIPDCKLASFSTLKYISSQYFIEFRNYFKAEFLKGFIVPAKTFDNVKGSFPIGFSIWNLSKKQKITSITTDVFFNDNVSIETKNFYPCDKGGFIIDWLRKYYDKKSETIAFLRMQGTDIQNNLGVFITNNLSQNDIVKHLFTMITRNNIIEMSIYFAVRKCIEATWFNDRDQFLYPNEEWERDSEFKNDCLAYTLFNNNIQSKYGTNHWIPFTEQEVNAHDKFESNFMTHFISGKKTNLGGGGGGSFARQMNMFMVFEPDVEYQIKPMKFSAEAEDVFDASRELWKYYHAVAGRDVARHVSTNGTYNVNASLYDIREYFQGRNESGKMNNTSEDTQYTELIGNLRDKLKVLAKKIEPKVYKYEFLKKN
jgi:hypothetical protein